MYIVLLVILLTAAAVDLFTLRIPNRIIVCGIASGMICSILQKGGQGIWESIAGILIPAVIPAVLYRFRIIGAGDVKLIAVAGSFLGVSVTLQCLFPILLFAGALSLLCFLMFLFRERRNAFHHRHMIPMAVPIFLGVFWYLHTNGLV